MRSIRGIFVVSALAAAAAAQAGVAPPEVITVTNNNDSGPGSLRNAIELANELPDPNLVEFVVDTAPVALQSAIVVEGPVSIRGRGARRTRVVAAEGQSIFFAQANPDAPFAMTLRDLVLEGTPDASPTEGEESSTVWVEKVDLTMQAVELVGGASGAGGALFVEGGSLYMENCLVADNFAGIGGGLYANDTTTRIYASRFQRNNAEVAGGAIVAVTGGTFELVDSVVEDNETGNSAGGIYTTATNVLVARSLIKDNATAGTAGGGLYAMGPTEVDAPIMIVENTTFTGNRVDSEGGVGAALELYSGRMILRNSTVVGNYAGNGIEAEVDAAGIHVDTGTTQLEIESSIVTGNYHVRETLEPSDVGRAIDPLFDENVLSVNHSLIGKAPAALQINGPQEANLFAVDPRLGPLADNGGPTLTFALLADSPAIDRGINDGALATDQRGPGYPRAVGAPDIGAFEKGGLPELLKDGFE